MTLHNCNPPVTRAWGGLELEKLSPTMIRLNPGHCADAAGSRVLDYPRTGLIGLGTVGTWGRDSPRPFAPGDDVFVYLVANPATLQVAALASRSIIYGDVVYPDGWTVARKHPLALKNFSGGLPNFHVGSGTGRHVRYTDAGYNGPFVMLHRQQSGGAWQTIHAAPWVPDAARLLSIECRTEYPSGGAAGSAYVRPIGIGGAGRLVGSAFPSSVQDVTTHEVRVGSTSTGLAFEWLTTGDAKLSITALGYEMTEPV